jgi:hypothetical protein
MGDLAPLSGTAPLIFCIDHIVTTVGIWMPTIEVACVGGANTFSAINIGVWTLIGSRAVPFGGYSSLPPGFAPSVMPATFFMEKEVRLGQA